MIYYRNVITMKIALVEQRELVEQGEQAEQGKLVEPAEQPNLWEKVSASKILLILLNHTILTL